MTSNLESIRNMVQKVTDVPIYSLRRKDFENTGYDGSKITDKKLLEYASKIEIALSTLYWEQIEQIAQDENLPTLDNN